MARIAFNARLRVDNWQIWRHYAVTFRRAVYVERTGAAPATQKGMREMQSVRELALEDAEAFRGIRLEALRLCPDAFGSVHAVEVKESVADFAARIARGGLFGGFVDGKLEGMAGFSVPNAAQLSHKGMLGGVYIRESWRGSGLAVSLVNGVLAHARDRVEQVQLSVAATNQRAIRFYRRLGFEAYATEPRALKVGQSYIDELLMVRFLTELPPE